MKYLLLAALLMGLIRPGSATSAQDIVGKEGGTVGMIVGKEGGIVTIPSKNSVDATVDRLKNTLRSKEITLFALIDHSGEAAKVGMKIPPTQLLIFGNPKGGTPLMLAAPNIALDLPLKILVAEDAEGKVWLSYTARVLEGAVWSTVEFADKYRGHRNNCGQGRRVVPRWRGSRNVKARCSV